MFFSLSAASSRTNLAAVVRRRGRSPRGCGGACTKGIEVVEAVLFDMDGVLAFTEPYYRCRRVAYLRGQGVDVSGVGDCTGMHDEEAWERCVPHDAKLRRRLRAGYERFAEEHPTPWDQLGNRRAHEVFLALKGLGVKTAICSSSPRFLIGECMDALNLEALTDYVISGDECASHKPDPEIYIRAAQALGVRLAQAIVVEDSPTGIRAGKAAGAFVCALRQPDGVLLDQREADLVIGALPDLLTLVEQPHPASSV